MSNFQYLLNDFQKNLIRTLATRLKNQEIGHNLVITRDRGQIVSVRFIGKNNHTIKLDEWQSIQDADLDRFDDLDFIRVKEHSTSQNLVSYTLNEARIMTVFEADFNLSEEQENKAEIGRIARKFRRSVEQIARDAKQTVQINQQTLLLPDEIQTSFTKFQKDHPVSSKVAFIMMAFDNSKAHMELLEVIRNTLRSFGITGLRADDKTYHDDLYWNMLTYIYGCQFGIAVFERIKSDVFNSNVTFEIGYMSGIGKEVCLLKDKAIPVLPADLIGKLYKPFDLFQISETLPSVLGKWLIDKGLGSTVYKELIEIYESLAEVTNEYKDFCRGDKSDNKQHGQLIGRAQDICENAAKYDVPCPPECLTVHTEADANKAEFKKVNESCQERLLYIARKRLTRNQPTKKDNLLEWEVWGNFDQRNLDALDTALKCIKDIMNETN